MSQPTPARKPPPKKHSNAPIEVVHPLWLAKALALTLLAALLCAWLTLCLLFYQGDWQLILHPSPTIAQTPASLNLPFSPIRFDAAETVSYTHLDVYKRQALRQAKTSGGQSRRNRQQDVRTRACHGVSKLRLTC